MTRSTAHPNAKTVRKQPHITDKWLEKNGTKLATSRGVEYRDSKLFGLGITLRQSGKHAWWVYAREPGRTRKVQRRIGVWPEIPRREAEERARHRLSLSRSVDPTASKTTVPAINIVSTFADVAVVALAERRITLKWAPSTFVNYERALRKHINPVIGKVLIADLKLAHIEQVVQSLNSTVVKNGEVVSNSYYNSARSAMVHVVNYANARKLCDVKIAKWTDEFPIRDPKQTKRKATNMMPEFWGLYVQTCWDILHPSIAASLVAQLLTAQRRIAVTQFCRSRAAKSRSTGRYTTLKLPWSQLKMKRAKVAESDRAGAWHPLAVSPQMDRLFKLCDDLWPETDHFFPAPRLTGSETNHDGNKDHVWDVAVRCKRVISTMNDLYALDLTFVPHDARHLFHTIANLPLEVRDSDDDGVFDFLDEAERPESHAATGQQYDAVTGLGYGGNLAVSWVQGRARFSDADKVGAAVYDDARRKRILDLTRPVLNDWGAYVERAVADAGVQLIPDAGDLVLDRPTLRRENGTTMKYGSYLKSRGFDWDSPTVKKS